MKVISDLHVFRLKHELFILISPPCIIEEGERENGWVWKPAKVNPPQHTKAFNASSLKTTECIKLHRGQGKKKKDLASYAKETIKPPSSCHLVIVFQNDSNVENENRQSNLLGKKSLKINLADQKI